MTCLVVGGAGFIGRALTRRLLDTGREVCVLGRRLERPAGLDPRASYRAGDYGDGNLLGPALARADEVIDLAYSTVPKSSFEDPVFDITTNLPQAANLLRTVALTGHVRRVLMVSSGGTVYGHARQPRVAEDHPTDPVSPYGITKLAIEKYALMYRALNELPVLIARPANAYGPGQLPFRGQGFIATAMASVMKGRPLTVYGGDRIVRDYIHLDDVVAGLLAVLDRGEAGHCYNIGSGVGRTTDQVLAEVLDAASLPVAQLNVSRQPARPFDVVSNVLDSTKLAARAGWQPAINFSAGIRDTWRWMSDQPESFFTTTS